MSVDFLAMDIAISGMNTSQRALEVTGHNVSNLSTTGYVRQQAIMESSFYRDCGTYQTGTGTSVQEVRQIRNFFLDNMYRQENNLLGYWDTRAKGIKDLENIIGEPMVDGMQVSLNQFWDSWHELSKNPESLTVRAMVVQRGNALVETINHMGEQINKLQEDLNTEILVKIDEVNEITGQIADLNVKVCSAKIANNSPNDYKDQRNVLIDKLSKLVKVDTQENWDGQVDIIVGGYFLVSKGVQTKLYGASEPGSTYYKPKIEGLNIDVNVGNGILKGLMEARGEVTNEEGSIANGTPNTRTDIVFAVDLSDDTSAGYIAKLNTSIDEYINDLGLEGLNYNIRLITYDGSGATTTDYGQNLTTFRNDISTLTTTANVGGDFGNVVTQLEGIPWRENSNRLVYTFTGETINHTAVTPDATVDDYVSRLNDNNIRLSVIGDSAAVAGVAPERGWQYITDETEGRTYDISVADYNELMSEINEDIVYDVNEGVATTPDEKNIISNVKRRLNALVNIIAREVNKLHQTGRTLTGNPGEAFFLVEDNDLPFEMCNIKINSVLDDYNNIAAGTEDSNGDNRIASQIAGLRSNNAMNAKDNVLSIDGYYRDIIVDVGNKGYESEQTALNQAKLVHSADEYRQGIMGASADEEMTNMVRYKYSYNAASKVINVVNTMMDTLINRTGAGRR